MVGSSCCMGGGIRFYNAGACPSFERPLLTVPNDLVSRKARTGLLSGLPEMKTSNFQLSLARISRWLSVEITNGQLPFVMIPGGQRSNSRRGSAVAPAGSAGFKNGKLPCTADRLRLHL